MTTRVLLAAMALGCADSAGKSRAATVMIAPPNPAAMDVAAQAGATAPPPTQPAATREMPAKLSETGLYVLGSTSETSPGVMAYDPRYPLWSDGTDKRRWLYLPDGAQIDTSDMDFWRFSEGAKLWKEFAKDGRRLETRLLWKRGGEWFLMAYVWDEWESDAYAAPDGVKNVRGTAHDVPSMNDCNTCHQGVPDRVLGVGAIQLAHAGAGLTVPQLSQLDKLSHPAAVATALPATLEWNALGYLHGNCGYCHNRSAAFGSVGLDLWLRTEELHAPAATATYRTLVNVPMRLTTGAFATRVLPGRPDTSGLLHRVGLRNQPGAMPPLATEVVDGDGCALLRDWIASIPSM